MIQATVQDPDQSIGQRSKRLVMGLASLLEPVVVVARAGGGGQGAKGPLVAGIGEPPIARHPGQDHPVLPDVLVMGELPA